MKNSKLYVLIGLILMAGLTFVTPASAENSDLTASIANYDPLPAVPGRTIDLYINLANTANVDARDVEIEFIDNYVFKLLNEKDRIEEISVIGSQKDYLLNYRVWVSEAAPDGEYDVNIRVSSRDQSGTFVTIPLTISVKGTQVPVSVSNVKLEDDMIVPGGKSKLTLSIKNLAKVSSLRDVVVTLNLNPVALSSTIVDLPFVPVDSTTQKVIDRLGPGQTGEVEFNIAAYPDATTGVYKIPVTLEYKDDAGTTYNKSVLIGVEVNSVPDLLVAVEGSTLNKNKLTGEVSFEITNKGLGDLKLLSVILGESDDYEILSPSNEIYLGNIDSDDFETARYQIKAEMVNEISFPLMVEYKDALNNKYSQEYQVKYIVREGQSSQGGTTGIIIVVVIILIIVGIVIIRKRKKKKSQKG